MIYLIINPEGVKDSSVAPSGLTSDKHPVAGITTPACGLDSPSGLDYNGLPYSEIIRKWWELYNEGKEPVKTNRDVLTFELAVNLRHICGFDRELLRAIVATHLNIGPRHVSLRDIDAAYSIAFPDATPVNVNKKRKHPALQCCSVADKNGTA